MPSPRSLIHQNRLGQIGLTTLTDPGKNLNKSMWQNWQILCKLLFGLALEEGTTYIATASISYRVRSSQRTEFLFDYFILTHQQHSNSKAIRLLNVEVKRSEILPFLVLPYKYNGGLVITFDWWVLLKQYQRVWTAFCEIFRDTPLRGGRCLLFLNDAMF